MEERGMTTWSDAVWTDPDKAAEIHVACMRNGDCILAAKIEKHWGLEGLSPERVLAEWNRLFIESIGGTIEGPQGDEQE